MEDKEKRSITEISREISGSLLDSYYMLEILENLTEDDARACTLVTYVKNNVQDSFKNIEKCRSMVSGAG